jgi:hypothetical protein
MGATLFVVATLIVLVGALAAARLLQLTGLIAGFLGVFTLFMAQVMGSLLVAGVMLQRLEPLVVLALNVVLSGSLLALLLHFAPPASRQSWRLSPLWRATCRRVAIYAGEMRCRPWVVALALLALAAATWLALLAVLLPPFDYDGLWYHLVSVVHWMQVGRIEVTPYTFYSNAYPEDTELFYTWLMLFLRSGALVRLGQLIFAMGGVAAVVGIARHCGLSRPSALASGCLFFLTPVMLLEATTDYVDLAFAAMFLICYYFLLRHLRQPSAANLLLMGVAGGIAMGMKSTGVAYVGIAVLVLGCGAAYRLWRNVRVPRVRARGARLPEARIGSRGRAPASDQPGWLWRAMAREGRALAISAATPVPTPDTVPTTPLAPRSGAPRSRGESGGLESASAPYTDTAMPGATRVDASAARARMARRWAGAMLLLIVPLLLFGSYWYVRDWMVYGNPLYPLTWQVAGHTFPGRGGVDEIQLSNDTIPQELMGRPAWQRVLLSWTNEPPSGAYEICVFDSAGQCAALLHETYAYDQRLGGFGPQWLYLEAPALLLFVVYAARRRRDLLWTFLLPFALIFLAQPDSWWNRYTIYLLAPSAIALVSVLDRLSWRPSGRALPALLPRLLRGAVQVACLGLVTLSVALAIGQAWFSPQLVSYALSVPLQQRTVGAMWYPQVLWVDYVPVGSRIGFTGELHDQWCVYPLFGPHFTNQVFMIQASDDTGLRAQLQADRVHYLFTNEDTQYAAWADADPTTFHLIYVYRTYRVYAVDPSGH